MCRVAQEHFRDEPVAAMGARGFVTVTLRQWGLGTIVPDMELAVTELMTNAILHARTPIVVTLSVAQSTTEVAVTDYDPRVPQALPQRQDLLADLDAISDSTTEDVDPRHQALHYGPSGSVTAGRGLIILDAISSSWGVTPHPDGKDVWARIPVPTEWPFLDACTCASGATQATASGRPLTHISGAWDLPQ